MLKSNRFQIAFIIFLIFLVLWATPTKALTYLWNNPVVVTETTTIADISIAEVSGHPAMVFSAWGTLYYTLSVENGISWTYPVRMMWTNSSYGAAVRYSDLKVVNGFPAISYYDTAEAALSYIRAYNTDGTSWPGPEYRKYIDHDGGWYTSLTELSNGYPAIAYYAAKVHEIRFVRALDVNGNEWASPITIEKVGLEGGSVSLLIVDGLPAISFHDDAEGKLKYVRALDSLGDSWREPVTVDGNSPSAVSSMAIINSFPAISYGGNGPLKFIRAMDINGTTWSSPKTLDGLTFNNWLEMVNGKPGIVYYNYEGIKFIPALDDNGTTWGNSQIIDSTGSGFFDGAVVNERVGIGYVDGWFGGILRYSSMAGYMDISVWAESDQIPNGTGGLDFGYTPAGSPLERTVTIRNDGDYPLQLESLSLPPGFSLSGSFGGVIEGGEATDLTLSMDAINPGNFSGTLYFSSTDSQASPYSFFLSGTTDNQISPHVEDTLLGERVLTHPIYPVTDINNIMVIFSEEVLDGNIPNGVENLDNFLLIHLNQEKTILSIDYTPGTKTAILNLAEPLESGLYTLTIKGSYIQDLLGNLLDGGAGDGTDFILNFKYLRPELKMVK